MDWKEYVLIVSHAQLTDRCTVSCVADWLGHVTYILLQDVGLTPTIF